MTTMKKFVLIASMFCVSFGFAQDEEYVAVEDNGIEEPDITYVSETAVLTKYHNEMELEKLGKLELTNLYIERCKILTEMMPFIALKSNPAGAGLDDLGIPKTKSNVQDLEKEVKSKNAYLDNLGHTMHDITPYADKRNIIWAIIFMEETIHKAEKAGKGL